MHDDRTADEMTTQETQARIRLLELNVEHLIARLDLLQGGSRPEVDDLGEHSSPREEEPATA